MTAEEIFAGETDNVEFKVDIPPKSEKYMKTVVAFANGNGGKLVFGVENNTWKVVGFSKDEVFQKMDAITVPSLIAVNQRLHRMWQYKKL
ncbi:MAG: ATP-binding protein [Erysipelotrichaceae bacterium]